MIASHGLVNTINIVGEAVVFAVCEKCPGAFTEVAVRGRNLLVRHMQASNTPTAASPLPRKIPNELRCRKRNPDTFANLSVLKVIRQGQVHSVLQFNVEILLDGPTDAAFTSADNSLIIPTDTQKNTVYVLAKTTSFTCAEDFAVIVARWVCGKETLFRKSVWRFDDKHSR